MPNKKIFPHGSLQQLAPNLWILEGTLPHTTLPRVMTIFRIHTKQLVIHSGIAVEDEVLHQIEALGKPTHLIVPNSMHRLDAAFYKEKFPQIKVVCPASAVEKVSREVEVDGTCEEEFKSSSLKAIPIPGIKHIELAFDFKLPDGNSALVFNDLIVNIQKLKGVSGWFLEKLGRIGNFRTPPAQKFLFVDDRPALRRWFESLSQRLDVEIVTMAHGRPVRENIPALFHRVAMKL